MERSQRLFEQLYRQHYGQLLASTTRLCGDLSHAEDLVQAAFEKAIKQWPAADYPDYVGAWLMKTAKNAALDEMRNQQRRSEKRAQHAIEEELGAYTMNDCAADQHPALQDDMLRLMFTCCHPALHIDARVALCLNTLCGLKTDEIAKAFITSHATMSQRLWRAKSKIRDAGIQYERPERDALAARMPSVLASIYLIFNEGWLASNNELQRFDLLNEAIRLGRLLSDSITQNDGKQYDAHALLALMLLQHSRRDARFSKDGELVLLNDQDRSLWHHGEIAEATELLKNIFKAGFGGTRYALMAAIAATHANSATAQSTDWHEISILYETLMELDPSPVIALNHAVAIGERDGAATGLKAINALQESSMMQRYYLYHAARADFLLRLEDYSEAAAAYQTAIKFCSSDVEKRFLNKRFQEAIALTRDTDPRH